jgi:secreted trypsin-like serine protease
LQINEFQKGLSMVKNSKSSPADFQDEMVRTAIARAEKQAGDDDREFARALNKHVRDALQKSTGEQRVIPIRAANTLTKDYHIFNDPRYLANVRALARRTHGGERVIGGKVVPSADFMDCVAVGSDAQWGCTGTLIAKNVVVTAGHCADFATRVYFGTDVAKPGKIVRVKKKVRHPQYHKAKHNDLMVLILEQAVEAVAPRKLATKTIIDLATDGRVVGFGATDANGMFGYGIKRFVDVPMASPACRGKVDGNDDSVTYGCDVGLELVAGRPLLEQDSCNGDSGGPFYVVDKKGAWVLGGATSRATDSAMHGCGDGGVYVRIEQYRTWIDGLAGVTLP